MRLQEIENKQEWEGFFSKISEKTFLQSWNWGDFTTAMGGKSWRLGIYNSELLAVALVVKVMAKRGTFLQISHGPIIQETLTIADKREVMQVFLEKLKNLAQEEGASFIRVSPLLVSNEENESLFEDLGFRPSPMPASAYEATWKLDLNPSEEDLYRALRKTTRYLIKKTTEDKDITMEKSTDEKDLALYQSLNREVSKRQNFVPFSDNFIKNEFEAFDKDREVMLFFGKYRGEVAAGAMVIFWSGMAFYHQAASVGKFAKVSIPYRLQWEAVLEAKKRGLAVYDFWGFTDPAKYPKHPWAGPTLFKMGFGGYPTEYVKTQDFVISSGYWVNYIIESIRKMKRGL